MTLSRTLLILCLLLGSQTVTPSTVTPYDDDDYDDDGRTPLLVYEAVEGVSTLCGFIWSAATGYMAWNTQDPQVARRRALSAAAIGVGATVTSSVARNFFNRWVNPLAQRLGLVSKQEDSGSIYRQEMKLHREKHRHHRNVLATGFLLNTLAVIALWNTDPDFTARLSAINTLSLMFALDAHINYKDPNLVKARP